MVAACSDDEPEAPAVVDEDGGRPSTDDKFPEGANPDETIVDYDAGDVSIPVKPRGPHPEFITAKNGGFQDGTKAWTPVGVNYWVSYALPYWGGDGMDWTTIWDNPAYPGVDAEKALEHDFALMEQNGINDIRLPMPFSLNSSSHSVAGVDPSTNPTPEGSYCKRLNRLLQIAQSHKVFITLVLPLDHGWWYMNPNSFEIVANDAALKTFVSYGSRVIEQCDLPDNRGIWAYDIDLESSVLRATSDPLNRLPGSESGVKLFNQWLIERYGSIAAAEARWGYSLERECGVARAGMNTCPGTAQPCSKPGTRVCPPLENEFVVDGIRPAFVKAYRAFMKWLITKRFQRIVGELKVHDPDHLYTSDAILNGDYCSPGFRFVDRDTSKYLDFVEPHVYDAKFSHLEASLAKFPSSPTNRKLVQSAAYLAYLKPDRRPVHIGEFGLSIKVGTEYQDPPVASELLSVQERFIPFEVDYFARGGASGARYWWFEGIRPFGWMNGNPAPTGTHEISDYGVVNPTGQARPALAKFKDVAKQVADAKASPVTTLKIDPTSHVCLGEAMAPVLGQAQAAVEANRRIVVNTQCTGTNSINAPLTCVDGSSYWQGCTTQPCCALLCLDAMFERVEYQTATGWERISNGGTINIAKGSKVRLRVTMGNVGEASWKAASVASGAVKIQISGVGVVSSRAPLSADVASFASTAPIEFDVFSSIQSDQLVGLRTIVEGRGLIGEAFGLAIHAL